MARILSQALHRPYSLKSSPFAILSQTRHRSFKAQLIEIDLDSSSSSSSSTASSAASGGVSEAETVAIKKLEEMIHLIVVQKSTPDWLPFMPGSSFWVPPQRRSNTIVDLVSKLANQLTEEETLSLTTLRGWPCSSFLLKDATKMGVEVDMLKKDGEQIEVKVEVLPDSESTSQPEDEER